MIQVNIENLEMVIHKYTKILNEYTALSTSITNELKIIEENWKSNKINELYTKIKEKYLNQQKIIEKLKKYIELLKNIYKKYQDLGDINIEENIGNKLLSVSTAEEKEYYQRIHKIETEIHTELNKKKEDVL